MQGGDASGAKSVIFNGLMEDLFSRNKDCRSGWEGRTVGEDLEVGGRVGLFVLRGGCESRDLLVTCCAVVAAVAVRAVSDTGIYTDA